MVQVYSPDFLLLTETPSSNPIITFILIAIKELQNTLKAALMILTTTTAIRFSANGLYTIPHMYVPVARVPILWRI